MNIWMPDGDKFTILRYLDPSDIMLEWGAGGSTLYFSKYVKEYHSIEHSPKYYQQLVNEVADNTHLYLCEANASRTLPTQEHQFIDYINYVEKLNIKFDKVLIDGRARQWCAIKVLKYLNKDAIVFVHDWIRLRYHSVLEHYELIEETSSMLIDANGLGILKVKE